MPETKLQKPLGGIDVFCISAGAMISSGIFLLPGLAFSHIGPAIYIAYILAGIFAFLGTLATIELATAMPLAGGIYYYIERSLGPMVGTVSGLLNWCAIAFKTAFAIFGMSEVMYQLFGGIPEWWAVGLTLVFVGVNLIGTQAAAWMQLIMVIFLLGIMAAFIVGGVPELRPGRLTPLFLEDKGWSDVFIMAAFVFVAFGGLLDVVSISEEVRNPRRNLPWGMMLALIVVTLFYGLILITLIGIMEPEVLAKSFTPLADAAKIYYGKTGFWVLTIGALMAYITTANAGIMAAARYPFALSRDKLIPRMFRKVYGKRQLPIPAILLTGALVAVVQFMDVNELVNAASTVVMLSYVLTNLAVIILRESEILNYRPSFRMPWYPILPLFNLAIFAALILAMGVTAIQLSLLIIGIGLLCYFVFGRKVNLEFALLHLLGRLSRNRIDSHGLESELRDIIRERDGLIRDDFDCLLEQAPAAIIEEKLEMNELFDRLSSWIAPKLQLNEAELAERFKQREEESSTAITPDVAVPHLTVQGKNIFKLYLIKCTEGVSFGSEYPEIKAVFVLLGSPDQRNRHLRTLAAIAQLIQSRSFDKRWNKARTPQQLNDVLLLGHRRRQAETPVPQT
ncbi:amino acid permease [Victivallis sp. Marseille-Q1083]|uniref:amino acid permease n=1 Tax=Victivallis sp. Marseille-Q1083 TaxID=2717288 RepID=UPI00158E49CC|nr:amino acid permease [Victivallis sp. Marseille-Q1083]